MHGLIRFCKCLSDPTAVRIVVLLLQNDLKINQIQRILQLNRSTINAHLTKLRDCNVVDEEQEGRWLRFRIHPESRAFVESMIREYENDLTWDPRISEDRIRLERERSILELLPLAKTTDSTDT